MHTKPRNAAKTQSATNALTAFYTPLRWILPFALGVIVFLEILRVPGGLGTETNFSILFMTVGLFIYGGAHRNHAMTAGVPPRSHALGGVLWTFLWSIGLSCANVLSVWLAEKRDYYHMMTDMFFVRVPGVRHLIDTNGDPYTGYDAGLGLDWVVINFAVHCACLLAAAGIGLLIGTISARWSARMAALVTAVGGVLAFGTDIIWYYEGPDIGAPVPGVFIFMLPLAVLGLLLAYIFSAKTQPRLQ